MGELRDVGLGHGDVGLGMGARVRGQRAKVRGRLWMRVRRVRRQVAGRLLG